jgi:nucleoside-diphosphate-sugar epimerase
MTHAFLTGGTGFIGQPLTLALLRRGWQVTALVRRPESPQAQALKRMGARLVKGDVADRAAVLAGMQGVEIVVHNAGVYELGVTPAEIRRMRSANVDGTGIVLGAALELSVPHTVYVSSVLAFGDTGKELREESFQRQAPCATAYEQSKTDAHAVAVEYQRRGLPLAIVCPGNVIGPNDHAAWGYFARLYINGVMPPMSWARRNTYVHSHVDDLAEGIALAAEKGRPGETYLLGGDRISMEEALSIWNTVPGGIRSRFWVPTRLAKTLFWSLEPLQRMIGLPAFMSRETAVSAGLNYNFSSEKAKRELGWAPRPARQTWLDTLEAERRLKARRNGAGLVARLRPLDDLYLLSEHGSLNEHGPLSEHGSLNEHRPLGEQTVLDQAA